MDRIIYTSMTGANASMNRQAVLANNLANASTTGFRAEMANFRSVPMLWAASARPSSHGRHTGHSSPIAGAAAR